MRLGTSIADYAEELAEVEGAYDDLCKIDRKTNPDEIILSAMHLTTVSEEIIALLKDALKTKVVSCRKAMAERLSTGGRDD